jgi:hypothetical protein
MDDFTEPIAIVIFIFTCMGCFLHGPTGWPLVHIRARTYLCQQACRVLVQGASHGECSIGNLFMQSKRNYFSSVTFILCNFLYFILI